MSATSSNQRDEAKYLPDYSRKPNRSNAGNQNNFRQGADINIQHADRIPAKDKQTNILPRPMLR